MIRIQGKEMHPGKGTPPLLGLVIEHPGFIGSMSGWRNLKYLAGIRGIAGDAQIKASLEQVGLLHEAKKPVKKYSLGMRQKLAIAQALMEAPDIYLMDEPFNGLDKHPPPPYKSCSWNCAPREKRSCWSATIPQTSVPFVMMCMQWKTAVYPAKNKSGGCCAMKKIFALSLTLFLLYCCSCAQATELTILGPEAFWEVGFSQAHPELKLNHSASEATGQAYLTLLMTSEDYDVFSLPVGPVYMSLLKKGICCLCRVQWKTMPLQTAYRLVSRMYW